MRKITFFWLLATLLLCIVRQAKAQDAEREKAMEIYGHIMLDGGYNFNQINPNWFDVVRPTQLPTSKNQFGTDGNTYMSVRQTRLGFKNYFKTGLGELKTQFEFELFGTGVDAGQTTFRLRHAYAELGKFGVGQYWSPFMDIDVFPNTLEYWGPNAMVFFRNVQIRYMPIQGENTKLTIALERPGASADQGVYSNRVELEDVSLRFPIPDISAEYRQGGKWGYVELAGILRHIEWKDQSTTSPYDLTGDAWGWGLNLSANIKFGRDVLRGQVVYGEGIQNYMNDAPVDIGIKNNLSSSTQPVVGVPLPLLGVVAFLDHTWSDKFTSSIGYSMLNIDNSDAQADDAFKKGQYAAVNLLYTPVKNVMAGVEFQWGDRQNFKDNFNPSVSKIQVSFKYNFSHTFYRN